MGNFSIKVSSNTQISNGETLIYQHPMHDEFMDFLKKSEISNIWSLFEESCLKFRNNKLFGSRNKSQGTYNFKSYEAVKNACLKLANSIIEKKLFYEFKERGEDLKLIAISSNSREEYLITELACNYLGITIIPIFENLIDKDILLILEELKIEVLFLDSTQFKKYMKIIEEFGLTHIKKIILFENDQVDLDVSSSSVEVIPYEHLFQTSELSDEYKYLFSKNVENPISVLCYTSWTSHRPKAAKLSEKSIVSYILAISYSFQNNSQDSSIEIPEDQGKQELTEEEEKKILESLDSLKEDDFLEDKKPISFKISEKDSYMSYLSLANSTERIILLILINCGASIGFFSGISQKIFEDIQQFNPSLFYGPPRVFVKIFDALTDSIEKLNTEKKNMVEKALKCKVDKYKKTGDFQHFLWDKLVFRKIKKLMGTNLRFMFTSSEMISESVLDFLKACFSCPIIKGYIQTEFLAAGLLTDPLDYIDGHEVSPVLGFQIKLIDNSNFNYFTSNSLFCDNNPQGEILLKGPSLFSGYLFENFSSNDGWIHTEVVGNINTLKKTLNILDKIQNLFYLKNSGRIEPERIENILINSKFVKQIFVYGDENKDYLIALILVNKQTLNNFFNKEQVNEEGSLKKVRKLSDRGSNKNLTKAKPIVKVDFTKDLNKQLDVIKEIQRDLDLISKLNNLKKYEYIKKIYIIDETYTIENDMLTPTMKIKRKNISSHYSKLIEEIYKN